MKIASLAPLGIDSRVIDLWRSAGHEELLPVQELAIQRCGVLKGRNILVFSPTSSGKTFVGEVAAIRTARQNRRVIYLVPQKALAEEKFDDFRRKYSPLGVRVVISTRDRKEFDRDINRGLFHIAVIVFEKMQGLLVNSPALLSKVGLVVVDELQMVGDKMRGPKLEILLTKIKTAPGSPQIIGLSAVLGGTQALADWFGASLCAQDARPVELRKGVLCNGRFRYQEHNTGREDVEELAPAVEGQASFVTQVKAFVDAGEQCLVFCRSKKDTLDAARALARALPAAPATRALHDVQDLDDSQGRDTLAGLLQRRIAYHNADLDWDQRHVIEKWFREGEIAVICATTTLAMGLNLPARNVFIDPERWHRDPYGSWTTVPISQAEYENMSGRAGRLGIEDQFGRAIIVTDSEFQAQVLHEQFVEGELDPIEPALGDDPLDHHVLNLVASKLCRTESEIRDLLLSSYTGETCWRGGEREAEFDEKLDKGIRKCLEGGLIEKADDGLAATRLGRLAAVKGIAVDTAIAMAKYACENREVAADLHLLEILFCLTGTEDGEGVWFNFSTPEFGSGCYHHLMAREYASLPPAARARLAWVQDPAARRYEPTKRIKKTLLLYEWVMGTPTRELEQRFYCFSGGAQGLATEFAWLAETFSSVAKICGWPEDVIKQLRDLSERLVHGVPEAGVEVAAMDVRGLGRGRVMSLIEHGVSTLATIAGASRDLLEGIVGKRVTARLLRCVASIQERQQLQKEESAPATPPEPEEPANVEATWTDTVPPSDDLGVSYQSTAKVHIDGRAEKRRHRVVVDGTEAWLTEQSFEAALKLAVASKTTGLGWVPCSAYGSSENFRQVVRRLKQDLQVTGIDPELLIENSGAKQYRLSVPPANVSIDAESVAVHFPEGKATLSSLKGDSRP